ncbi:hypothetical protein [Ralstonia pseudosolanacearum]|uniref:hypothetical protein n=1 Tax=Ralstonia pseudosolanacearum TaxID=1310165 RepID=UPI001E5F603E|nr:hypothetical protein [Ralstonia pseudosolanacearum]
MPSHTPITVPAGLHDQPRLAEHWIARADLPSICSQTGTPVFIYSEAQLVRNIRRVKSAISAAGLDGRVSIFVPFFPNANPHILKPLRDEGRHPAADAKRVQAHHPVRVLRFHRLARPCLQ